MPWLLPSERHQPSVNALDVCQEKLVRHVPMDGRVAGWAFWNPAYLFGQPFEFCLESGRTWDDQIAWHARNIGFDFPVGLAHIQPQPLEGPEPRPWFLFLALPDDLFGVTKIFVIEHAIQGDFVREAIRCLPTCTARAIFRIMLLDHYCEAETSCLVKHNEFGAYADDEVVSVPTASLMSLALVPISRATCDIAVKAASDLQFPVALCSSGPNLEAVSNSWDKPPQEGLRPPGNPVLWLQKNMHMLDDLHVADEEWVFDLQPSPAMNWRSSNMSSTISLFEHLPLREEGQPYEEPHMPNSVSKALFSSAQDLADLLEINLIDERLLENYESLSEMPPETKTWLETDVSRQFVYWNLQDTSDITFYTDGSCANGSAAWAFVVEITDSEGQYLIGYQHGPLNQATHVLDGLIQITAY